MVRGRFQFEGLTGLCDTYFIDEILGAVLIGRDSDSSSGALRSCMKEALSSSRLGSPECSFGIFLVSLGLLNANNLLVMRGLIRLISSLICSFL